MSSESHRESVRVDYAQRIAEHDQKQFSKLEINPAYSADDLAALPEDAVGASFGCGNPFAHSGIKPGDTVVDLGSGAGLDLILARERVGAAGKVIGVDITEEMCERARDNVAKAGYSENVEVKLGLIEDLPLESNSVDWVISNCVVNLSPEKERVFSEIRRVLKPGGHFVISDIVVNDVAPWVRRIVGRFNESVAKAVSEEQYLQTMRDVGLVNVKIYDRLVYEESSIRGMIDDELGLLRKGRFGAQKAQIAGWLAQPIAKRSAGRVVSIKVGGAVPNDN